MEHSPSFSPGLEWDLFRWPLQVYPPSISILLTCIDHMDPLNLQLLDGFDQREAPAEVSWREGVENSLKVFVSLAPSLPGPYD